MFRYFALLLSGILTLSPAAVDEAPASAVTETSSGEIVSTETVAEEEPAEDETGAMTGGMMLVNPMRKMASLDEINESVGCTVTSPEGHNAENESFFVYNVTPVLGQYKFTVAETAYTLRASETADDISGICNGGTTLGDAADENGTDTAVLDNGIWMRRFVGTMQYSLFAEGENFTVDEVSAVFDTLIANTEDSAE